MNENMSEFEKQVRAEAEFINPIAAFIASFRKLMIDYGITAEIKLMPNEQGYTGFLLRKTDQSQAAFILLREFTQIYESDIEDYIVYRGVEEDYE